MGKQSKRPTRRDNHARGPEPKPRSDRGEKTVRPLLLLGATTVVMAVIVLFLLVFSKPPDSNQKSGDQLNNLQPIQKPSPPSRPPKRDVTSPHPLDVLDELVRSHPDQWVRTELDSLLRQGRIFWNIQEHSEFIKMGTNANAYFFLTREGMATNMEDPNSFLPGDTPGINIQRSDVMNPLISKETLWAIIFHEAYHFRQYLDGRCPAEMWRGYRTLKEYNTAIGPKNFARWFECETEAHLEQCEFQIKNGWTPGFVFCQEYATNGYRGLRRYLARSYSRQPLFASRIEHLRELAEQ